jgi:hypothetical protein
MADGRKARGPRWIEQRRSPRYDIVKAEESEAEEKARTARLLESRGIGPIDFRQLQPGDLYTCGPAAPIRTVTGADHLVAGASLICWTPGPEEKRRSCST